MNNLIEALEKCNNVIEEYYQDMGKKFLNPKFIEALDKITIAIKEAKEIDNQYNESDIEQSKELLEKANIEVLISAKKERGT